MKPGRDLDALVNEKIFRIISLKVREGNPAGMKPGWPDNIPHYSTDISAAWGVVENMCIVDVAQVRKINENGKEEVFYSCKIVTEMCKVFKEYGNTAPHAICLAALRAVGAWE